MCGISCICSLGGACCVYDMDYIQSNSNISRRGPDVCNSHKSTLWSSVEALFAGFVLHLRGHLTEQPVQDKEGNILLWNGEIFAGMEVPENANDTEVLFNHLVSCDTREEVLGAIQSIQGPWAFIYWQAKHERLWFGRDVFGRRSLLWHLPQRDNNVFALSSVPVTHHEYVEVPSVGLFCLESSQSLDSKVDAQYQESSSDSGIGQAPQVPVLHLHLYPWQRAVWPGTDVEVASDCASAVTQKLGLEDNAYIAVSLQADCPLHSWMPVLNKHIPEDGSLVNVAAFAEAGDSIVRILQEMETKGELRAVVTQLENVLQDAVTKRVYNLPRSSDCDQETDGSFAANDPASHCSTNALCHYLPVPNIDDAVAHSGSKKNCSNKSLADQTHCASTAAMSDSLNSFAHVAVESSPQVSSQDMSTETTSPSTAARVAKSSNCILPSGTSMVDLSLSHPEHNSVETKLKLLPRHDQSSTSGSGMEMNSLEENCMAAASYNSSEQHCAKANSQAHIAILFSGGVDCTVLAALADRCLPVDEPIDLINVAFEQKNSAPQTSKKNRYYQRSMDSQATVGSSSYNVPDRQTGYLALSELNPHRIWNFVEVNVTQDMLSKQRSRHVRHLVYPLNTVLDDSIGCALWFAAMGKGILGNGTHRGQPYSSMARVILCGMGADEQLAGYSRHRVCFQQKSWVGLINEIDMEVHRISARNLGRDDRTITDHGKESRFPYLDENVAAFLASLPVHQKADLRLPRGIGEKLLLRLLALRLNLPNTAVLPKRAIQFGSRIAKLEQGKEKGIHVCQRLTQE